MHCSAGCGRGYPTGREWWIGRHRGFALGYPRPPQISNQCWPKCRGWRWPCQTHRWPCPKSALPRPSECAADCVLVGQSNGRRGQGGLHPPSSPRGCCWEWSVFRAGQRRWRPIFGPQCHGRGHCGQPLLGRLCPRCRSGWHRRIAWPQHGRGHPRRRGNRPKRPHFRTSALCRRLLFPPVQAKRPRPLPNPLGWQKCSRCPNGMG